MTAKVLQLPTAPQTLRLTQVNQHAVRVSFDSSMKIGNRVYASVTDLIIPACNIGLNQSNPDGTEYGTRHYFECAVKTQPNAYRYLTVAQDSLTNAWELDIWVSEERCHTTMPQRRRRNMTDRNLIGTLKLLGGTNGHRFLPKPGQVFEEIFLGHSAAACRGVHHPIVH